MKYKVNDFLLVDFPISEKQAICFIVAVHENDKVYQVEFYDDSCLQVIVAESQIIKKLKATTKNDTTTKGV